MIRTFFRGHPITYDKEKGEWVYDDDNSPANIERPCKRCGHMPLPDGEDYCLGHIPRVKAACCGHGAEPGYIMMESGQVFTEDIGWVEPSQFKIGSETVYGKKRIFIDQYFHGEVKSSVNILCSEEDFESNMRDMEKVCRLLNELEIGFDEAQKIKLILNMGRGPLKGEKEGGNR